jgi:hypothetical protein
MQRVDDIKIPKEAFNQTSRERRDIGGEGKLEQEDFFVS